MEEDDDYTRHELHPIPDPEELERIHRANEEKAKAERERGAIGGHGSLR